VFIGDGIIFNIYSTQTLESSIPCITPIGTKFTMNNVVETLCIRYTGKNSIDRNRVADII
jgi:hypothetical protein